MGKRRGRGSLASDPEGFERLYRLHSERVLRYCFRRTGDWSVADDIRSAVFCEAWRRRHDVDLDTRAALPWLYGVAANMIRNHARSARRREAAFRRLPPPAPEVDLADEIADRLYASDRAREVAGLLEELPPGERAVLVLCVVDDMSYRAAARALDVPVGTVRSRLSRARARLDELRSGRGGPPRP